MTAGHDPLPWTRLPGGIRLSVRLTPRAGRDALGGLRTDETGATRILARVSAAPVDGAANAALIRLVARTLGVAKSSVAITSGQTARAKTLEISGDPTALEARLKELTS